MQRAFYFECGLDVSEQYFDLNICKKLAGEYCFLHKSEVMIYAIDFRGEVVGAKHLICIVKYEHHRVIFHKL